MSSALLPARSYLVSPLMDSSHPVHQHSVQSQLRRSWIPEHELNRPR
jgi:hypothetical protein